MTNMANLDKLNKTIEELVLNSDKIKSVSETLAEINSLYLKIEHINQGQENLNKTTQEVKELSSDLIKKTLNKIEVDQAEQNKLNENLLSNFNQLNKGQQELNDELLNLVRSISSENAKLYLDQKQHVENQLKLNFEESKTQSIKMKDDLLTTISSLDKRIENLEDSTAQSFETNEKAVKLNKTLLISALGIGALNILISFFI